MVLLSSPTRLRRQKRKSGFTEDKNLQQPAAMADTGRLDRNADQLNFIMALCR